MRVFLSFLFFVSIHSFGQLGREMDAACESELHRIVLNYKKNGVDRFTIRYISSFSKWRILGKKYHYHIVDDSTLVHRKRFEKHAYKIESNGFEKIWTKEDSIEFAASWDDNFFVIKDSSGFTTTYHYEVKNNQDTVLTYMHAIKREGDTLIQVNMWSNLSEGQKSILITLSDTSSFSQSWVYRSGAWYKFSEVSSSIHEEQNRRTTTRRIKQFGGIQESNEKVSEWSIIVETDYTKNNRGLIREIRHFERTENLNLKGSSFIDKTMFKLSIKPLLSGG